MNLRPLLLLPALVLTAGCIKLGGGKPPATLMTLTADSSIPTGAARTATADNAISISVPSVPTSLGSPRVPVQTDATNIAFVKDAQWMDVPARLFRNLLAETVSARTGRVVLDLRQFGVVAGTRVTGRLNRFGYDVPSRSVIVSYDGAIRRGENSDLETRRFEVKVPSKDTAPEIGEALNRAANQVAVEVADWIR